MLGLRSAQGRAILAGVVLIVLLVTVTTLAGWRAQEQDQRLEELEQKSLAVTALERAYAQFRQQQTLFFSRTLSDDATLIDDYQNAVATTEQHLSEARAHALAQGDADLVLALDDLSERISQSNEEMNPDIFFAPGAELDPALQSTIGPPNGGGPEGFTETAAITADLEELAREEQEELAAMRASTDRAADNTLWLLIGFSAAAFLVAAGTVAMLIVSVVRPLASLRASAQAITSGDSEARAEVAGPEEVSSLARAFNDMTDALAAKTQEHIDTTNLTGDIILKTDKDGRFSFLNDAACQFLGKPREELLGIEYADYLHPEDAALTAQVTQQSMESKQPIEGLANRYLTPMGPRVVEWHAIPLFADDSRFVGFQATGRDITDRKQAEEALRESEERFRSLTTSAPIGVFLTDPQSDCVYANPRLQAISGLTLEESLGYGWSKVIHPDDRAAVVEAAEKATRGAREFSHEFRMVTPKGELRWAHVHTSPMLSAQGKQMGRVGTLEDITERKRTEETLQESEERYRTLVDSTHDMIQSVAPDGRLLFVNRAWLNTLGYTEAELPGLSLFDVIHPESLSHCQELFSKVLAGEPIDHVEATFVAKDGKPILIEGHVSARRVGGRVVATHGFFRDITDRKRAEEALRASESKYRTLLGNLPQRIFFKDRNSVYVSCNDNYARDLHIIPDEIAGKTDYDFYPQELADKYRADDKRIMASGKTDDIEERYLQDGQEAFVHTVKTPVRDEDGNVIGILGIFWDISEQKKMEQERERLHAELEIRAITDSLTGLYNHAHFYQRLAEEIERSNRYGRGFAIIMTDVDNFKQFNDTRGHQAGDEALCLIADCIRSGLRRSDIPFRYGGDEFAAILLHADSSRAQAIAKRVKRCVTRRFQEVNDPAAAWLGLSAGVACFPDDATTVDDLVRIADAALYDAKRVIHAPSAIEQAQAAGPLVTAEAAGRSRRS